MAFNSTLTNVQLEEIKSVFETQRAHQFEVARSTVQQRRKKLQKLLTAVHKYSDEIKSASFRDQGKPELEVLTTEIYQITSEIKKARSELSEWMDNHSVRTPITLLGASSYFKYEPKGVCLIISPWNFPFNLSLCPLVSAIAAGNTVILKPSENTPHASALIKKILNETFEEREVAVIVGGVECSSALLKLPFNHIFFTGSSEIGKHVMKSCCGTFEQRNIGIGRKVTNNSRRNSPYKKCSKKNCMGKFMNNGQICIAPDYVFVHEKKKNEFIQELKATIDSFYGNEVQESNDYSRIVNDRHQKRLASYLHDAKQKDFTFYREGKTVQEKRFIGPTLLNAPVNKSELMLNEIFGPLLPIITYSHIDQVIQHINRGEKPLALYIYSDSSKKSTYIIENTRAGGTVINNNNIQFSNGNCRLAE